MINVRAVKRLKTKLKRQSQKCQVFEIKLDKSKLSKKSLEHLCKIFLEAGLRTNSIPMDRRDFKARENVSSTYFDSIYGIKVSKMCSMN